MLAQTAEGDRSVDLIADPRMRPNSSFGGRYRLEREIGRGGMAIVFLAEDLKHHRPVALKILQPEVANAIGSARFLQEIEIVSGLTHPNVLPLYDSGESGGLLYYVMPYVDGETLRDRLVREKQLSLEDAIRIIADVADGVEYAHQHDIVHRDIKPENILLQGGRAVVADFGIARAVSRSAKQPLTSSGVILGTAHYMSPEQAMGEHGVSPRADIYSLGCVFYEMLVGEPPYTGPTAQAIVTKHAIADIPSVRMVRPDIPPEVDRIVRKALGKVAASRYPSAAVFAQNLKSYQGARRWHFENKRRLAMIAAVAVLAVAATLVVTKRIFARPLEQNDWILAADFDGPARDPRIAPAFRDLVTTALKQSQFVRVMERRQLSEIMRQAGIAETTFVDIDLARQLAQRASVRAVLVGSILPLGSGYSAVLHVVSAANGRPLASAAAAAEGPNWEGTLVNAVGNEVNQLRTQLGERRQDVAGNRALRDVATPSFKAFQYYSEALDSELMSGDFRHAKELLDSAIVLDSGFAWAWVGRATIFVNERQLDSARAAYYKALAFPNRLSAADRYQLKGDLAYALDHDIPSALKWYDLYLAEVPYSVSGRSNRAVYRSALGEYEEAESDLKEAVQSNPFGPGLIQPSLLNLAATQVVLGHTNDARETLKKLSGSFAEYVQIMLATAQSQWPTADSIAVRALSDSATQGLFRINATTAHASALAAQGSALAADSVLRNAVSLSKGSAARWYERARLLLWLSAGQSLGSRALSPADTSLPATMLRALYDAQSGDTARARLSVPKPGELSARNVALIGAGADLVRGLIASRAGRWGEVTDSLGPVALAGEQDPTMLDRPDSFLERWIVADAYERAGKLDSAAVYFELLLKPTRVPPGHLALRGLTYGFSHYRLAEIDHRKGDNAEEIRHRNALKQAFVHKDRITAGLIAGQMELDRSRLSSASEGLRVALTRTHTGDGDRFPFRR